MKIELEGQTNIAQGHHLERVQIAPRRADRHARPRAPGRARTPPSRSTCRPRRKAACARRRCGCRPRSPARTAHSSNRRRGSELPDAHPSARAEGSGGLGARDTGPRGASSKQPATQAGPMAGRSSSSSSGLALLLYRARRRAASSADIARRGDYAAFAGCPLGNRGPICASSRGPKAARFEIGRRTIPITKTITLQGGIHEDEAAGRQRFIAAAGGEDPLRDAPADSGRAARARRRQRSLPVARAGSVRSTDRTAKHRA